MKKIFVTVMQRFGINQTIVFAITARFWQMSAGTITTIFIAIIFSPAQQGFYYLFGSLLALQICFELGLSFVISQFASHKFVNLHWDKRGKISGNESEIHHFTLFFIKTLKWYTAAAVLFIVLVIPGGLLFLNSRVFSYHFAWQLPWIAAVITTGGTLVLNALLAILEGTGQVLSINRFRLLQNMLASGSSWLALIKGAGLFTIAINNGVIILVGVTGLVWQYRWFIKKLWHSFFSLPGSENFSWRREIFPMQWRIALSWISGYFLNQVFTPIIFYYHGAIPAGQLGMSLTLSNMLGLIAITWVNVQMPNFGKLIAAKKWQQLDELFFRIFLQSIMVACIIFIAVWVAIALFHDYPITHRLLPLNQLLLLFTTAIINQIIAALALYLRAHKREPFTWFSVTGALLTVITVVSLSRPYSTLGAVLGIVLVNFVYGLPSTILLWLTARRRWHVT